VTQPSFSVDPERVRDIAGAAGSVHHFCEDTEYVMGDLPAHGADTFGDPGVAAAYAEFFRRWKSEAHVTAVAANVFVEALVTSLDDYQRSDGGAVQRFRGR
jgi:hypothetical protein